MLVEHMSLIQEYCIRNASFRALLIQMDGMLGNFKAKSK